MYRSWTKDYPPVPEDFTAEALDENTGLKKLLRLVGENKRVVDFGCATGYFAKLLNHRGCTVTGIEINQKAARVAENYCTQVIVADLDFVSVKEILPSEEFDVAVFGDILEHLRNPWKALEETKQILKKDGYVVASIPNIAHGAVRLALLQGRFEYAESGILDDTHLRFFTRKTVEELFKSSGYFVDAVDRTTVPIFVDNSLVPKNDKQDFNSELIEQIEQDEEAETLQFIVSAFPLTIEGKYAALNERYSKLQTESEKLQLQLQSTQVELERSHSQLQSTQVELERSHSQLQSTQVELERSHSQLQSTQVELERSHSQLQSTQVELERSHSQLQSTQVELERSLETIKAMESSKFWKLRQAWFRLKRVMGIKTDD